MITSTSNSRVKVARKLQRKRYRQHEQQMLVEGVRLVADAFSAGVVPVCVYYASKMATSDEANSLLDALMVRGIECVACAPAVIQTLSGTVTPQGIVAVVPVPRLAEPESPRLVLVLDSVRDPGNAGTLLRAAEAAGVDLVLFAPGTVDAFNDKTLRAGMGAHFRLPLRVCNAPNELVARLSKIEAVYVADARANALYDQVNWRRSAALIVGGEAAGASDWVRELAQPLVIPMKTPVESLNAALAGAIILFEAARQRRGHSTENEHGI